GRRSRRRTRKRGGSADSAAESEPAPRTTEVVAKARPVREPITEPQRLKGSTRLEAKKQRRRDGRDAGRRRAVVTEAEFLARRESVERVMVVRSVADRIEIGVLEDSVLAEHYVAKAANASLIGNVYLGRVQNVLPDTERARLKKILKEVLPDGVGVIVRTAAEGATEEQLTVDVNRLTAQWQHISTQVEKVQAPALLHSEPDLLVKIIRDVFNEDF